MGVVVDRKNKDAAKPKEGSDQFITLFVDGSHCPETNAWGIGVWIKSSEYPKSHTFARGGIGLTNSTDVEYEGIKLALEWVEENQPTQGRILVIQCDNIGALNRIDKFKTKMKHKLQFLKLKHVKGHNGNGTNRSRVNGIVDGLAYQCMCKYRSKAKRA